MAHERITGLDLTQEARVQWIDDGASVGLALFWDDPDTAEQARDEHDGQPREAAPGVPAPGWAVRPCQDAEGRWSIYIHFDRPRVNALIRILRRARNKAFGADE